jgi:integrase
VSGERFRIVFYERQADGSKKRREVTKRGEETAKTFAMEMWASQVSDGERLSSDLPYWVVLQAWLDPALHAGWRSDGTVLKHRASAKHLRREIGSLRCRDISAVQYNLALESVASRGLSNGTVKAVLDVIRAVHNWGMDEGVWPHYDRTLSNVGMPLSKQIPDISAPVDRTKVPTRPQVESLVAAATAIRPEHGAMIQLAADSGLRLGELIALRPEDIDLVQRVVHVDRQLRESSGRQEFATPKHEKTRKSVFSAATGERLRPLVDATPAGELLFRTPTRHKPWRRSYFYDVVFNPASGDSDFPEHLTMHSLRHFFCLETLRRLGTNEVAVVARLAGHHSPRFTMERYVGAGDDYLAVAASGF